MAGTCYRKINAGIRHAFGAGGDSHRTKSLFVIARRPGADAAIQIAAERADFLDRRGCFAVSR
jgi:hypothetical protein